MQTMKDGQLEIKSAKDIIDSMRNSISIQTPELINWRIFKRKKMNTDSIYNYCPYCVQRIKRAGLNYQSELSPLEIRTIKMLLRYKENKGIIEYENLCFCDKCKNIDGSEKEITIEDFRKVYVAAPVYNSINTNRIIDLTDKTALENF